MENDIALKNLINITNRNIGFIPSSPTDFNNLSRLIEEKTNLKISLSSIKRLWGYVDYNNFPSSTTLNTLSRFNGYENWKTFLSKQEIHDAECSEYLTEEMVNTDTLQPGDILTICWENDKFCVLEYLSEQRFRTIEAENIKIKPEDNFRLQTLCIGLPFTATDIIRGTEKIPGYIGAKKNGIRSIRIKNRYHG